MAEPVIRVTGLGKRYVIGHEARHDTFRDTLAHGAVGALRRLFRRAPARTTEEFWAIRDVSFEVNQGDVVGIIGRNGAGKSTLLKILSRITEPTVGSVRLRGRVASLLEVGTGFHPELSGRENIYLNGAILGMSRAEIARKFDEIVAFAEVERFLDTPVKHYSSGMYVRLAFAVAAHLEPEILIVDEVLAVGDAQFQRKCLGKMKAVAGSGGRTVLFVSHNIGAVRQLTTKCLFLERGLVSHAGATADVIDRYTRATEATGALGQGRYCSVLDVAITDEQGHRLSVHEGTATLWLEVEVELDGLPGRSLECTLTDLEGLPLGLYSPGHFSGWRFPEHRGRARFRLPLALPSLATGSYGIDVATTVHGSGPDHHVPSAVILTVSRPPGTTKWDLRKEYNAGYLLLDAGDPRPVSSS